MILCNFLKKGREVVKPKIAILTIKNSYKYGGVSTCTRQVYKFCEQYFNPTVFVLNFDKDISTSLKSFKFSSGVKKSNYFGMNCVEVGARWAFWEPGHYAYNLKSWEKELANYDYFFMNSGHGIAAYPLVQLNKKFAMWIASGYLDDKIERVKNMSWPRYIVDKLASPYMKKIEKEILHKADFIWTTSKYTKRDVEKILGDKRDKLVVCNFPVDVKEASVTKNRNNIIAVGRFSDPRKNVEMLLRVFDKLYQKDSGLKLIVVGSKPTDKVLSKFNKFSSFKNVTFTGSISREEMEQYYQKSSLMLLTSYQEGLGIVGLEAMSYGIPVVATDCGGTADYVVNGKNGYLVKINDDKEMVNRSLEVLSSKEIHKKMSEYSFEFVKDNFSENKIHSIFKVGLCSVYPELKDFFEQVDISKSLKISKPIKEPYESISN